MKNVIRKKIIRKLIVIIVVIRGKKVTYFTVIKGKPKTLQSRPIFKKDQNGRKTAVN